MAQSDYNSTGFDPYMSTTINITDLPGFCDRTINQGICDFCNATLNPGPFDNRRENCTYDVLVNVCDPDSSLYNSTPCNTVGGVNGTLDVMVSGSSLLEGLSIFKIPEHKAYVALCEQAIVYLIMACVFCLLFYRDWSRKSMYSDLYHMMFTSKAHKN